MNYRRIRTGLNTIRQNNQWQTTEKRIDEGSRGLSGQILSEVLGLEPILESESESGTSKRCESALTPTKVLGGKYTGKMKNGERYRYGEIRYDNADVSE